MEEEKYYGEIEDHQYYTQQRNKTKGNNGSQMYKYTISLTYMISDACWKSSKQIAKHIYFLVYENYLSKLNSIDLHSNILFFSIN